jgi:trans-aconitate methyltransferase
MKVPNDYPFLSKIFLELVSNQQFKTAFQAVAPEIYADIESASTNPNCSCRGKVENYVNTNRQKALDFLNNFIENTGVEVDLQAITQKYTIKSYAGVVEKVKISEWQTFQNRLTQERANFRAFSTSKIDDEYVNVFFL